MTKLLRQDDINQTFQPGLAEIVKMSATSCVVEGCIKFRGGATESNKLLLL